MDCIPDASCEHGSTLLGCDDDAREGRIDPRRYDPLEGVNVSVL